MKKVRLIWLCCHGNCTNPSSVCRLALQDRKEEQIKAGTLDRKYSLSSWAPICKDLLYVLVMMSAHVIISQIKLYCQKHIIWLWLLWQKCEWWETDTVLYMHAQFRDPKTQGDSTWSQLEWKHHQLKSQKQGSFLSINQKIVIILVVTLRSHQLVQDEI